MLPVFSESRNSTNKSEDRSRTRAFGVSLLENSCLLAQDTDSGFVYADAFSSLQNAQPTSSAPGEFSLPAVFQDVPDTDLGSGLVQASFNSSLTETEQNSADFSEMDAVNLQVDTIDNFDMPLNAPVMQSSAAYGSSGVNSVAQFNVGVDLYGAPDFKNGLLIYGQNVALKIGGYVKADFIYDFDPIDSTDSFDTTKIPVDALARTNSRFHARQSRLSFDTRWKGAGEVVKIYVEGDFFSTNDW